jgi:hypothetical protein
MVFIKMKSELSIIINYLFLKISFLVEILVGLYTAARIELIYTVDVVDVAGYRI